MLVLGQDRRRKTKANGAWVSGEHTACTPYHGGSIEDRMSLLASWTQRREQRLSCIKLTLCSSLLPSPRSFRRSVWILPDQALDDWHVQTRRRKKLDDRETLDLCEKEVVNPATALETASVVKDSGFLAERIDLWDIHLSAFSWLEGLEDNLRMSCARPGYSSVPRYLHPTALPCEKGIVQTRHR